MDADARAGWRAVRPLLPDAGLFALASAAESGGRGLVQGRTAAPAGAGPPGGGSGWCDRPVSGACLVGYALWRGLRLRTCAEVDDQFARVMAAAADGPPGGPSPRWRFECATAFLDFFDGLSRAAALRVAARLARGELRRRRKLAAGAGRPA